MFRNYWLTIGYSYELLMNLFFNKIKSLAEIKLTNNNLMFLKNVKNFKW